MHDTATTRPEQLPSAQYLDTCREAARVRRRKIYLWPTSNESIGGSWASSIHLMVPWDRPYIVVRPDGTMSRYAALYDPAVTVRTR